MLFTKYGKGKVLTAGDVFYNKDKLLESMFRNTVIINNEPYLKNIGTTCPLVLSFRANGHNLRLITSSKHPKPSVLLFLAPDISSGELTYSIMPYVQGRPS